VSDGGEDLDDRYLEEIHERIRNSPFHQWAGIKLLTIGGGRAQVALDLQPHHLNPQGISHGGVISSVADAAIGLALRSKLAPGFTHRTAQLDVHFLAKSESGRILGLGRAVHVGRQSGYGEADIEDGDGKLLARASATFIILPAPGAFTE
jgi:uncharacterized protein (TIGR00369 family)